MPHQQRQTIWFIGEARDSELRFCLRESRSLTRSLSSEHFDSLSELLERHPSGRNDQASRPNLVVVLQDWSGQYSESQINALISLVMPGRLLCVYGSWCESDGRNNADLWPHGVRVAARNAPERLERELRSISQNEPALPLTAGRDERFEHNHSLPPTGGLRRTTAHVASSDRRLRECLEARLLSNEIAVHEDARTCDGVVWAPDLMGQTEQAAREFAREHNGRRIVTITAMPDLAAGQTPILMSDRQLVAAVSER